MIRSRRVVLPEGERAAAVHVRGGRIAAIAEWDDVPAGCALHDAGDLAVMPGVVDTHVHVNEPGRTEWEGFDTATRSAAAGGITTLVDMPLNSVPATTSATALVAKAAAARGRCRVDVAFWGGAVPGNVPEMEGLLQAGARGFKCFLVPSGVDEFPALWGDDLRAAMAEIARLESVLLVHAESPDVIADAAFASVDGDARAYETYLRTRPPEAEDEAVARLVELVRETGCRVHVVHVASQSAVPIVRAAQVEGLPLTAETCPHYLRFAAQDVPDGATEFKCAPPIRDRANRDHLWDALEAGTLSLVASDHSPCPPEMKGAADGDFLAAWGGIASLQVWLPVLWSEAQTRGHTLRQIAEWTARAPARLAGLHDRKGAIAVGLDADLMAWDPDASFVVDPARLHHRHPVTPYAGAILQGVVRTTWVRGQVVFADGELTGPPAGRLLLPGEG
ncbi:MAG TPA: allantoinase AllB [Longimicrobiaceae bacterium]|nr:allantoinase AllB [Longimicrobiaceae bacterium]